MLASGKMVTFPLVLSGLWHCSRRQRQGSWEAGTLVFESREVGERLPILHVHYS